MKAYVRESGGTALNLSLPEGGVWLSSKRGLISLLHLEFACLSYFCYSLVNLKMRLPVGFQRPNIHTKFHDNWSAGPRFEMSYRAWRGRKGDVLLHQSVFLFGGKVD